MLCDKCWWYCDDDPGEPPYCVALNCETWPELEPSECSHFREIVYADD